MPIVHQKGILDDVKIANVILNKIYQTSSAPILAKHTIKETEVLPSLLLHPGSSDQSHAYIQQLHEVPQTRVIMLSPIFDEIKMSSNNNKGDQFVAIIMLQN